jgi:prephenate dehydrogenase
MSFRRLCIIGVGLIGGSVARAVRKAGVCQQIVGVDQCPENLAKAVDLGVIDAGFAAVAKGAEGADGVMIAAPVGSLPAIFAGLKPVWTEEAVYTDAGSTKQDVIAAARSALGFVPANFVPGHPIAGAERSGVEAAQENLFRNKRVILTPVAGVTDERATALVTALWEAAGAQVSRMDAHHHDEVLAATSHLPHVLAYALTHMLGRKDEQQEIFCYAAGGFRDFTRIASSDPRMWQDICLANREQIIPLLQQFGDELQRVAGLMKEGSAQSLFDYFTEARSARQRFLDQLEK